MEQKKSLPYIDRLSIVLAFMTGVLTLIYGIPPEVTPTMGSFLGIRLNFRVDYYSILPFFNCALMLAGSLWVMSSPWGKAAGIRTPWRQLPNVIIPVLTVLVLSITLRQMTRGSLWWVILAFGVLMLGMVIVAEYQVVILRPAQNIPARVGLIALSHSLFLILCIALSSAHMRLYVQIPLLFLGSVFVSYRALSLRTDHAPALSWIITIPVIITQIAVALNYYFINPITFGLLTTGVLYALGALAQGLIQKLTKVRLLAEPLAMSVAMVILMLLFGAR